MLASTSMWRIPLLFTDRDAWVLARRNLIAKLKDIDFGVANASQWSRRSSLSTWCVDVQEPDVCHSSPP